MNASAGTAVRRTAQRVERELLDQALTRAAGAPLVGGNAVRLLEDAAENYPAWLAAIRGARDKIFFENYFIVEDDVGAEFAAALSDRARAGVRVRVIYDWMGSFSRTSRHFWRSLSDAGVEVRCFNPPQFLRPFDWTHRDHRKMVAVDSRIGYITGLCVGRMWVGDPARGIDPWRDTGMELRGPALRDVERAFAQVWSATGPALPDEECLSAEPIPEEGSVAVRIVANAPGTASLLRVDQIVAGAARETLWLTDAYFAGVPPYVQALRSAALDGVDVRLLVPGSSDIPILRPLSQAGFRPLLEAGVRVFEWKGSMLHAKTGVADGRWARVGSSNLNIASWVGNYELDAVVEDVPFAESMEEMYLADLENATEIVLQPRRRSSGSRPLFRERRRTVRDGASGGGGSASRAAAGALRIGRTVGAALTDKRVLATTDARVVAVVGALLLGVAVIAVLWPLLIAVPIGVVLAWLAIALLARAYELRRERRRRGMPTTRLERAAEERPPDSAATRPPAGD